MNPASEKSFRAIAPETANRSKKTLELYNLAFHPSTEKPGIHAMAEPKKKCHKYNNKEQFYVMAR